MTFRFAPSDDVRHAITDSVLIVTVDRPEKRNPLSLGQGLAYSSGMFDIGQVEVLKGPQSLF